MRDLFQDILILLRVHSRVVISLAVTAAALWLFALVSFWVVSDNPKTCLLCHYERPFYEKWATSSHHQVTCMKCHSIGAFKATLYTVKYLAGVYAPVPRAKVEDASCLAHGCHEERLKNPTVQFGSITFDHNRHVGEITRGGHRLHCASCHGQLVVGDHLVVDRGICFLCHFKGSGPGQSATGCPSCHGTPTQEVEHDGFTFSHQSYLQIGVECRQCHLQIKTGDGEVPRDRCHNCHVERMELYNQPVVLHRVHAGEHGIACLDCHQRIEHGEVQMIQALEIGCENCHQRLHSNQKELYMGASARGVADLPSRMFAAQVTCDGCHTHPVTARRHGAEIIGERSLEAERRSCVDCHGQGYDAMLDLWIGEGDKMLAALEPEIAAARRILGRGQVPPTAQPLLEDAVFNYSLVKQGRPVHNVEYAVRTLQTAWDQIDVARAALEPGYRPHLRPPILAKPDAYCTAFCHRITGVPEKVYFEEMRHDFPHRKHIEEIQVPCTRCHSPRQHKMRIITKAGCMECHHGKRDLECTTCHQGVEALRTGQAVGFGVKPAPDYMAGLDCTDCHDFADPAQTVKEIRPRCVECHDEDYGKMLDQWYTDWRNGRTEVQALLEAARLRLDDLRRDGAAVAAQEKLLAEAETNFRITEDGFGMHNADYTLGLLREARNRLNQIVETAPPPAK